MKECGLEEESTADFSRSDIKPLENLCTNNMYFPPKGKNKVYLDENVNYFTDNI